MENMGILKAAAAIRAAAKGTARRLLIPSAITAALAIATPIPTASAATPMAALASPSEPVALLDDTTITRGALQIFAQFSGSKSFTDIQVFTASPRELKPLTESLALECLAARRAQEPGSGVDPALLRKCLGKLDKTYRDTLHYLEVESRISPPSSAEIEDYYRRNPSLFIIPANFTYRQLNLLFPSPPAGKKPGAFMPPLAPEENERAAIRKKLEKAREQLQAGANFQTVAGAFPASPAKGGVLEGRLAPRGPKEPPNPVAKAAEMTPVGGISDIFEIPGGLALLQVVDKTEPLIKPLETAREMIANTLKEQKTQERVEKFLASLLAQPDVTVRRDLLENPRTSSGTVVVSFDGMEFLRGEFPPFPQEGGTPASILLRSKRLCDALALTRARKLRLENTGEFLAFACGADNAPFIQLRNAWLAALRKKQESRGITEEEALRYFNDHPAAFTIPPVVTFLLFAVKAENPESRMEIESAVQRAGKLLKDVNTVEEFRRAAAERSDITPEMTTRGSVENARLDKLPARLAAEARRAPENTRGSVFYDAPYAKVFWMLKKTAARPARLEEIRPGLVKTAREIMLNNFEIDTAAALKKDIRVRLLSE